jgi:NFU1 iron-sulfur cluster scaffold homolog, mitochondrial
MLHLKVISTQNPAILKFEFPDFISQNQNFEFKNIDEAGPSPLAQKLFYLPFVKTVYISGNFVAIERYSIVEWADVQEAVAEEIESFVNQGGSILDIEKLPSKKSAVTVYGETTPNPGTLKFVVNKMVTKTAIEFKNIDETKASPLAKELFTFPYVKELFIDENYISISKYDSYEWNDISVELRSFIKLYIENGGPILDETQLELQPKVEKQKIEHYDQLDVTSQQIINILEEYVKPAVAADGGNILFDSYDESEKRVKVILQGACNGCPSSTFTLKNGIENMLKDMLKDENIKVEAING